MNKYPFIFSDELRYRLQRHLYFWLFWWLFQGFLYAFTPARIPLSYVERLPISLVESAIFLLSHMFLSYLLMYFILPRYLLKNKYLLTVLWVLLAFFATASFAHFLSEYVVTPVTIFLFPKLLFLLKHRPDSYSFWMGLLAGLRGGLTIGGLAAAIKLMKHWYVKEQRNLQLQKENAESQLQLLKAQVHPHFLFNTLNNIYSHTQNVAPVASHLVMGLSDLLRSMLYECNQPLIPLAKELKMIENYILLEKIRYDEQFDVHVDVPKETGDLYIAPLLLLPLVENSFKHGASNMLEQPWLNLQVHLDGDVMKMKLMNGKAVDASPKGNSFGIGIANVRKRLELLYPGKHTFKIIDEEEVFVVDLSVQLEPIQNVARSKDEPVYVLSQL